MGAPPRFALRLATVLLAAGAVLAAAVGASLHIAGAVDHVVAHAEPLPAFDPLPQRSRVLAADGSLLAVLYDENRAPIPLHEVPDVLVDAVIATEDQAFYDHNGIDLRAIARAAVANAREGGIEQGGSTITQQLVKKTYLAPDRTIERKIREAAMALRLEEELGKDGILERYLNTVYFGAGAYGARAAAERFFGKPVGDLDIAEAALLAGLIASPERFDPFDDPDAARARRSMVLGRMVEEGYITAEQAGQAMAAPLPDVPAAPSQAPPNYFVEEVKRVLLRDPRLGDTQQERFDLLFRGGVQIHTTLDPWVQRAAEEAVRTQLPASPFSAALVALDPTTGAVRAMVGGPGLEDLRYNLATQGQRQTGSTFKVVGLTTAIEAGYSPEAAVDGSAPCTFPMPDGQEPWSVGNYGGERGGVMTLRQATEKSLNCAYAQLAMAVGADRIAGMSERLGITRELPAVPSLALGTASVSPLEMATVAATLAADGVRRDPYIVSRVVDRHGDTVLEADPDPRQAVPAQVARTSIDVLRGVIQRGTGRAADPGRPAFGKTGTNQEWRDAWFVGAVPQLATAVWMGHPDGQVSMRVDGRPVTGGSWPAQIWGTFMRTALAPWAVIDFPPPDRALWGGPPTIGDLAVPEASRPAPRRVERDGGGGDGDGDGEGDRRGRPNRDDD